MAYVINEGYAAYVPIANTDAGFTPANGSSAIPTPPCALGTVVRGIDPTFGEGEFIMLKGVASTVIGSVVIYDGTTFATTLCPTTKNQARPVAVAMSACNTTALFGWYQIGGTAVALKGTGTVTTKATVAVTTTGKIGATNSGIEIQSARSANTTTLTSAITSVQLIIDRPHMQGRIT